MLLPEGASNWNTPSMFTFSTPSENGATTTITQDESRGSKVIHVADASVFTDKKHIRLIMKANTSANADYLDNKDARDLWTVINNEGIELSEFHEIVSIDLIENTVTLKDPIVDDIKSTMNWTANAYTLLENVGFEDIHFKANFTDPFVHHKDYIHDYAWNGVDMVRVADSWVTRSRFTNVTKAAGMGLAYASSIHTILIDGNAGHTIGNIGGNSSRVLQGLIWDNTNNGTFHGADISGGSNGSVTWRVESEQGSGWDLHANQPRTNLVDNYASTGISSIGGNVVNLPNHLTGLILWNQSATETTQTDPINFWPGDCLGNYCGPTLVSPIIVGYHGNETTFDETSLKYQESTGTKVIPESLYEAELEHRLVFEVPSEKSETFTNMTVFGRTKKHLLVITVLNGLSNKMLKVLLRGILTLLKEFFSKDKQPNLLQREMFPYSLAQLLVV
ncbi:DUF4955 domain-containing protein [Colwellia sp. MSW7]|uniref:DUF4955 domain-containing protein n=1 Tax=Colwellia maritima TaxID=2912588 RepID=A0ABS9X588_9GAMM|nr:DUF4955 domain-containing protein [Colwellia maritima]MCI2285408.1 DUF4955 domain-containing protein [Colwellia maritima]